MELNRYIDHTILAADATEADVLRIVEEAKQYNFYSVCVNGAFANLVHEKLEGTDVKTCVVVGFPLGAMSTAAKLYETKDALENGADEIDMVVNVSWLKDCEDEKVRDEIAELKHAVGPDRVLKVIIETCLLNEEQKKRAARLCVEAGADFVKTSTGFSTGGATVEDIRLIKEVVGDDALIKASGGIRTKDAALAMIEAGANRIGASKGVAFMAE